VTLLSACRKEGTKTVSTPSYNPWPSFFPSSLLWTCYDFYMDYIYYFEIKISRDGLNCEVLSLIRVSLLSRLYTACTVFLLAAKWERNLIFKYTSVTCSSVRLSRNALGSVAWQSARTGHNMNLAGHCISFLVEIWNILIVLLDIHSEFISGSIGRDLFTFFYWTVLH